MEHLRKDPNDPTVSPPEEEAFWERAGQRLIDVLSAKHGVPPADDFPVSELDQPQFNVGNLPLVDDPVNPKEAMSEEERARIREWLKKEADMLARRRETVAQHVVEPKIKALQEQGVLPLSPFELAWDEPLSIPELGITLQPGNEVYIANSWDELAKAAWSETPVVYEEPQPDVIVERKGE